MSDYKNYLPVPNLIYHFTVNDLGRGTTSWLYKVWRAEDSPNHQFHITLIFQH